MLVQEQELPHQNSGLMFHWVKTYHSPRGLDVSGLVEEDPQYLAQEWVDVLAQESVVMLTQKRVVERGQDRVVVLAQEDMAVLAQEDMAVLAQRKVYLHCLAEGISGSSGA